MAKQLTFEQSLAEQGRIDCFEWTGCPGAVLMDRPRRELLARTCFAAYQHRRVGARDLRNALGNPLHSRAATDQVMFQM